MGLDSKLIGVGSFSESIADCLDYAESKYENVKRGYPIATIVFSCWTSSMSRELAEQLDVDVWDFSTHFIPNEKARKLIIENFPEEKCKRDFYRLVGAGFNFYFLPDG